MNVKLTAVGKFQRYFPARTSVLDFPGTTLPEFFTWMKKEYGLDTKSHRNIKITHNSIMVRDLTGPLRDGDRIGIIPIVAGG